MEPHKKGKAAQRASPHNMPVQKGSNNAVVMAEVPAKSGRARERQIGAAIAKRIVEARDVYGFVVCTIPGPAAKVELYHPDTPATRTRVSVTMHGLRALIALIREAAIWNHTK